MTRQFTGPGDEHALLTLVSRYALFADDGDGPAFGHLFAPGATLEIPGVTFDTPGALEAIPGKLRERYAETLHQLASWHFEPGTAPGTATGTVRCIANHIEIGDDGAATNKVMVVEYRDRYRRGVDGWRIERRAMRTLWTARQAVDA